MGVYAVRHGFVYSWVSGLLLRNLARVAKKVANSAFLAINKSTVTQRLKPNSLDDCRMFVSGGGYTVDGQNPALPIIRNIP